MKRLLTTSFAVCLLLLPIIGFTQGATSPPPSTEDDFTPFMLVLVLVAVGVLIGSILIGSVAALLILTFLFVLISAGIVSTSIVVGLYRRSLAAGFKTLLGLVCGAGGVIIGAIAFWLINHFFHIHLKDATAVLAGAASGLLGGLLLGMVIFWLIRMFLEFCRQKLSLRW